MLTLEAEKSGVGLQREPITANGWFLEVQFDYFVTTTYPYICTPMNPEPAGWNANPQRMCMQAVRYLACTEKAVSSTESSSRGGLNCNEGKCGCD